VKRHFFHVHFLFGGIVVVVVVVICTSFLVKFWSQSGTQTDANTQYCTQRWLAVRGISQFGSSNQVFGDCLVDYVIEILFDIWAQDGLDIDAL